MWILDLQDRHAIDGAALLPAAEIDRRNGNNAGNFAFRYALTQRFFPQAQAGTFALLNDLVAPDTAVLMACSNWIGLSPEHEQANQERFESLQSSRVRTVPFGLGCQLPADTRFEALGPWTQRFLAQLAGSSPSMSVRDEQTAAILEQMGYRQAVVTGCPSNFIHPAPDLGARLAQRLQVLLDEGAGWADLALCMTEYSGGYTFSADLFRRQYQLIKAHAATYVVQDFPLLAFLLRETAELPVEYSLHHFPGMEAGIATLARHLRRAGVYFSAFDDWLLHMRRFDLCLGMRLHGNMAALQSGTPALVLTHDERTAQLCETMSLPHLPAQDWLGLPADDPAPLLHHMLPALSRYDARRCELAQRMSGHLQACGLETPPALAALLTTAAPESAS